MSSVEIAALLLTIVAASFGIWIGLRLTKRPGVVAVDRSMSQRLVKAALLTGAVVVGLWIGNRGNLTEPGAIALGLLLWSAVIFMTFRRPKRG